MPMVGAKGAYTVFVHQDENPESPRDWDNLGKMVCFHPRYSLGDAHNYGDKDDFLRQLYLETVGDNEQGEARYDRLLDRFDVPEYGGYGSMQYARAVDAALLDAIQKKHVVLPLYLLDHSGLRMNTTGFSCPWDSGQVGWIYADKATITQAFMVDKFTQSIRQRAESALRAEVEVYDHYLCGDCAGYELYKNSVMVDSCWGFYGNPDQIREGMAGYMPAPCKGILDNLVEYQPKQSLKDLLRQARAQVEEHSAPVAHRSVGAR